jgi:hypothetical protein
MTHRLTAAAEFAFTVLVLLAVLYAGGAVHAHC